MTRAHRLLGRARHRAGIGVLAAIALAAGVVQAHASTAPGTPVTGHVSTFGSPVYTASAPDDFPDPQMLLDGDTYYGYGTGGGSRHIRLITSHDLATWSSATDALPSVPDWSTPGYTWAPSVAKIQGVFVMFYTTRVAATGMQCISRATSLRPGGPFDDHSGRPIICQPEHGGSIDPSIFTASNGSSFLTWKTEGVVNREPPIIWSIPLRADGAWFSGGASQLIRQDQAWEFPIIEGPRMVREPAGAYILFYSGSDWYSDHYGIGFAICRQPWGPCSKPRNGPLLSTGGAGVSPGAPDVVSDTQGSTRLTYHAWDHAIGYDQGGVRDPHIADLAFYGHLPVVNPPVRARVPSPHGGYYTLLGNGTVHAWDGAPWYGSQHWNQDIARSLEIHPGGNGYTVVDYVGRRYSFGF